MEQDIKIYTEAPSMGWKFQQPPPTYIEENGEAGVYGYIVDENGFPVATINYDYFYTSNVKAFHDGVIMSFAPEMLEALKEVIDNPRGTVAALERCIDLITKIEKHRIYATSKHKC